MLYDYACPSCGSEATRVNRIAERRTNAPDCCGQKMNIVIKTAPYGYVDRPIRYVCPVTNLPVTSKKQRREIMAREGLVSAHELLRTKEQRQADTDERKEIVKKGFGPKEVQKQVDEWAQKQIA